MTDLPEQIATTFDAAPPPIRARWLDLRDVIHAAADATGTAPLTETLKWGQPAFLPDRKRGTTIRLGWDGPDMALMLVHCQTDLVARWSSLFPTEFSYRSTRAACIPATGPIARDALHHMVSMALTYHRSKRLTQ